MKVKYLAQEQDTTKPVRLELNSEVSTIKNPLLRLPIEIQRNIHRVRYSRAHLTLVSLSVLMPTTAVAIMILCGKNTL